LNGLNEWGPLEEIVVGRLAIATIPFRHLGRDLQRPAMGGTVPGLGRLQVPQMLIEQAQQEP
jgi:hypothetical protein